MSEERELPPEADEPTVQELGIIRSTLNQIRSAGIEGSISEGVTLQEENRENENQDDGIPDVTDTPFLRELAQRQGAKARHARRWRPLYIAGLRTAPFPTVAARLLRVDPNTVALHKERDPIFAEACRIAEDEGASLLLASAWSSAVEGNLEPVFHMGVKVGHIRKHSERMRELLLKAMFPSMFDRTQKVNMRVSGGNGSGDGPDDLDPKEVHKIVATLSPLMAARHAAMLANQKPAELPSKDGFIKLDQVPDSGAQQSQNATTQK